MENLSMTDKRVYNEFIRRGQKDRAKKFLKDIETYGKIYEEVKKAWKSVRQRDYNLSTYKGWSQLLKAYKEAFNKKFPNVLTDRQIKHSITSDKMKNAFDSWDYLTDNIIKKTDKTNLFVKFHSLPPKKRKTIFERNEMSEHWPFKPGKTEIWYMKPSFTRDGFMGYDFLKKNGNLPDKKNLKKTHVLLGTMGEKNLDKIFTMMQGEKWSPKGEAKSHLEKKKLGHTSMSVGDIIVVGSKAHMVDLHGFKSLDRVNELTNLRKLIRQEIEEAISANPRAIQRDLDTLATATDNISSVVHRIKRYDVSSSKTVEAALELLGNALDNLSTKI